jgi:cell division protease FtsH
MTDSKIATLIERARYSGPTVTADQLVGVDSCLRQLAGQLQLMARPELAQRYGLEPSGTLFIGAPGTGKTLLARYLAGMLGVPLYQFSADEIGSDPETLRAVFHRLGNQRALCFIDEISILAQRREWGSGNTRRTLVALLTSLDGLPAATSADRLWVIGACTPDIDLDPAIYRSGRLGVVVEFALPSEKQRGELFKLYLRNVPHRVTRPEIARLAEISDDASGADIHDWVSQAASEALAEKPDGEPIIRYRHLEKVVARHGFVAAEGRPGREPTWEVAVHEAAHAVVAYQLFGLDAIARVSVGFERSQGGAWDDFAHGHFHLSRDWFMANKPTSRNWQSHAAISLAGAAAEMSFLGYRGEGAATDVGKATKLIMDQLDTADPAFGPSRAAIEGNSGVHDALAGSEVMRVIAWSLTRTRFEECWEQTTSLVREHRTKIERLAEELLLSDGPLTGDEIMAVVDPETHQATRPKVPAGNGRRRRGTAPAPDPDLRSRELEAVG